MQLSSNEKQSLITALAACTPSGGGSAPYTLLRKLCAEWGIEPNLESVLAYQERAARELSE